MEPSKDIENQILEAAKRVFVRKGYEATRMSDIATEAGINRTALHYYFRTKDTLFNAIFSQLMETFLPNIGLIMEGKEPILEKLDGLIDEYVFIISSNPSFPLFVANEANRNPEQLYKAVLSDTKRIQPVIKLRQQILREMEEGLLKRMPLIDVLTTLVSIIVFPLLMRKTFTDVFLDGNEQEFDAYYQRRKEIAKKVMRYLLTPDKPNK